jgi:hypothetical protein
MQNTEPKVPKSPIKRTNNKNHSLVFKCLILDQCGTEPCQCSSLGIPVRSLAWFTQLKMFEAILDKYARWPKYWTKSAQSNKPTTKKFIWSFEFLVLDQCGIEPCQCSSLGIPGRSLTWFTQLKMSEAILYKYARWPKYWTKSGQTPNQTNKQKQKFFTDLLSFLFWISVGQSPGNVVH